MTMSRPTFMVKTEKEVHLSQLEGPRDALRQLRFLKIF